MTPIAIDESRRWETPSGRLSDRLWARLWVRLGGGIWGGLGGRIRDVVWDIYSRTKTDGSDID